MATPNGRRCAALEMAWKQQQKEAPWLGNVFAATSFECRQGAKQKIYTNTLFHQLPHTRAPSFLPEAFPHPLSQIVRIVCGIETYWNAIISICSRSRPKHSAACVLWEVAFLQDDDPTEECPERHLSLDCGETSSSSCNIPGPSKCVQIVPFHQKKPTKRHKFYTLGRSKFIYIYIYNNYNILNLHHFWHSKMQSTLRTSIGPLMMRSWRSFVVLWELVRRTSAEQYEAKELVHELPPQTWTLEDISVLVLVILQTCWFAIVFGMF